ncbi:MAG: sulfatase/phosphatase domain-containing protein, partial [Tangfeifania sp.]
EITPQPLQGQSLMPVLEGQQKHEADFYISGWTDRFRMFRQGDFKIVKLNNEDWQLYNLEEDPTEINNLAELMPEKTEAMEMAYKQKQSVLNEAAK